MAWLQRLIETLAIYSASDMTSPSPKPKIDFDEITIRWLIDHLPTKKWVVFFGILVAIFIGGATVGQTTFVRELLGKKLEGNTGLSCLELNGRLDELLRAHNLRWKQLNDEIIEQTKKGSDKEGSFVNFSAIQTLQKQLEKEDEVYENDVRTLKTLATR